MDLYIFRHGLAAPRGLGQSDEARTLTEQGHLLFGAAAQGLRDRGLRLDRIWMSPYERTRETAAHLAPCLKSGEPAATDLLVRPPGMELLELLLSSGAQRVAVIGHVPYVGELAGLLAFGDRHLGSRLAFNPGTMAHLEGTPQPQGMALLSLSHQELLGG